MTIFDAAAAQNASSQKEALAALARGGSAARNAYLAAQRAQTADKSAVFRDILDRATAISAPAAGAELAAKAAPALDLRAQSLAGSSSSNDSLLGSIAAAHRSYFDEVARAEPIVRARAQQAAAEAKARQQAEANPIGDILKQLGGIGPARALANYGVEDQAQRQAKDFSERRGANGPGSAPRLIEEIRTERLGANAEALGFPASYAPALREEPPKPAAVSQAQHRSDVTRRVLEHANRNTADAFVDIVAGRPEDEEFYAVPAARSLAEATRELSSWNDAELRAAGVSRDVLYRWLVDYFGA